jgi:hypothetical protein
MTWPSAVPRARAAARQNPERGEAGRRGGAGRGRGGRVGRGGEKRRGRAGGTSCAITQAKSGGIGSFKGNNTRRPLFFSACAGMIHDTSKQHFRSKKFAP